MPVGCSGRRSCPGGSGRARGLSHQGRSCASSGCHSGTGALLIYPNRLQVLFLKMLNIHTMRNSLCVAPCLPGLRMGCTVAMLPHLLLELGLTSVRLGAKTTLSLSGSGNSSLNSSKTVKSRPTDISVMPLQKNRTFEKHRFEKSRMRTTVQQLRIQSIQIDTLSSFLRIVP